jgi:hypothetical protein
MVYPPDDIWLQKFLEEQRRIDKLLNPFYDQKLLDSINIPRAGISNEYLTLHHEIQNKLGSIESITKEIEFFKKSSLFDQIIANQDNLYRFQDQFSQTKVLFEPASARIEAVLSAAEATYRMFHPQEYYYYFTLSSIAEYQSFLDRQYNLVQYDNDIIAGRRMQINDLSGELFEIINASLGIGVALDGQEEYQSENINNDENFQRGFYSQINQQLDFVYSERYSGDIKTKFDNTLPARTTRLGYAITEQIYKINLFFENSGQDQVFKPTSFTMRACATIPSLIVRSEIDFYHLIDCLFSLLYEGSGSANRLIAITNKSFLEPLWTVKHLRLSARHDIDHGSEKDIEKKRSKIRDAYISLIAKPLPMSQNDWQKAQLQIYVKIDLMLQKIIKGIINNN